jgi:thiol-disulfide isomerase/thioredoxin
MKKSKSSLTTPKAAKLLLQKFTAAWCGPCRSMKPVLKKFCAAHPELAFAEVDCEDPTGYEKSKRMKVSALPTMVITFADDDRPKPKELGRHAGTCDAAGLEALLLQATKAAAKARR